MTDHLIQKLEEKTMSILAELELLRREILQLRQENNTLKSEKMNSTKKLEELISSLNLFDVTQSIEIVTGNSEYEAVK